MVRQPMLCLTIQIKKNDEINGKRLEKVLLEFLKKSKVSGATVWLGVDGFGKSCKSTFLLEGLTINQPMMIDVVEEIHWRSKTLISSNKLPNIVIFCTLIFLM